MNEQEQEGILSVITEKNQGSLIFAIYVLPRIMEGYEKIGSILVSYL